MNGPFTKKCLEPLTTPTGALPSRCSINSYNMIERSKDGSGRGDEMGSSVEGLKLRRMRILRRALRETGLAQ